MFVVSVFSNVLKYTAHSDGRGAKLTAHRVRDPRSKARFGIPSYPKLKGSGLAARPRFKFGRR